MELVMLMFVANCYISMVLSQYEAIMTIGFYPIKIIQRARTIYPTFPREFIAALPITQEIQTTQGRLLLCHGIGEHDMVRITADDYGYALEANFELQEVVFSNHYVHG